MGDSADRVTEAAKAAVEQTTTRIDEFLAARRKQAAQNDDAESADLRRHQAERAEAVRIRNASLRARFAALGLRGDAVETFLASLPESIP